MRLERADIDALMREPSAKVRATLCEKICRGYNEKSYSEREQVLALEIIRLLLRDTSIRVRQAISETLKDNPEVPYDVVLKLAEDHELVATPMLSSSPVLQEEDLIAIVQSCTNLKKLLAVASRQTISAPLSEALFGTGEHMAALQVISNPGAVIDDETFRYLLEEYYEDDSILEALVHRANLPFTVAERLFYFVSDQMRAMLVERYGLPQQLAEETSRTAHETATLRLMSAWMGQQDIQKLVQEMARDGRLSDSMIIRSLCIGDLRFFQTAIAKRADISVSNAKILMLDPSGKGFAACYRNAGLPEHFLSAVQTVYFAALEETQLGQFQHEQFTQRVTERIMERGYDQTVEHMPMILGMLGKSLAHEGRYH